VGGHGIAGTPRVVLIDEIDKAPRDFPNDLLHELDKMEFTIAETGETIRAPREKRPIVFITSNSERRLPEPFLRRCVYHHIRFDDALVAKAVDNRRDEYATLSPDFLQMAVQRFLALRDRPLRKLPSTGELLVWLRVLALAIGTYPERLEQDLSQLPYLGVLLKDHQDIEDVGGSG
jgi:MoxR-like ATPase